MFPELFEDGIGMCNGKEGIEMTKCKMVSLRLCTYAIILDG